MNSEGSLCRKTLQNLFLICSPCTPIALLSSGLSGESERKRSARKSAYGLPAKAGKPGDGALCRSVAMHSARGYPKGCGSRILREVGAVHPVAKHLMTRFTLLLLAPGIDVVCVELAVLPLDGYSPRSLYGQGQRLKAQGCRKVQDWRAERFPHLRPALPLYSMCEGCRGLKPRLCAALERKRRSWGYLKGLKANPIVIRKIGKRFGQNHSATGQYGGKRAWQ